MKVSRVICVLSLQLIVVVFCLNFQTSSAACSYSGCKIKTKDGKTIDLNSYNNFLTYNDKSNNRYYDFQPCGTIAANDPANCLDNKGCQRESSSSHPMGAPGSGKCDDSSGDPAVSFDGVADGGYKRSIKATYKCDTTQEGLTLVLTGSVPVASDQSEYQFSITGKDACGKSGGGGGGGGGSGMDGASVFLIIFFVVIAVYLIAGVIYKGAVKGARGLEIIPNVEFWKTVPGLIKDGALFIYRSIASKLCNKEYNQV